MGILAGIGNIYFVYQFLKKLVTPFEKTKAFELGIVDKDGKILKRRRDLKTQAEKDAYTLSDTLIWNIKNYWERFLAVNLESHHMRLHYF